MSNTPDRDVNNYDLWSAIRGLGMYGMSRDALQVLADRHERIPLFASKVIAMAARQVASTEPW
jgi:hypothetical protein